MAVRITSENFPTIQGETFRVEIHDSGVFSVANTVDIGSDGFSLSYEGETDKVVPGIIGSNLSVSILVTPSNGNDLEDLLTDLIGSVETRFNVVVWRVVSNTDFLYWVGYVMKDLSGFEDIGTSYFLTVKATDGIGRLKGVEYKDTGSTPNIPYGNLQTSAHLTRALTYIGTQSFWGGTDEWLRTVVDWKDGNMPVLDENTDPLQFSRFPGDVFATRAKSNDGDDYDWKSAYYVLDQLCLHWGARLMLSDGAWRFEQIRVRHNTTFTERWYDNATGFLGGTVAGSYDRAIPQNEVRSRLTGGEFSYLPALSRVEVLYNHRTQKNYIENLSWKWYKGSGANDPFVKTGISFDADTYFRCSGVLNIDVEVVTYTKPWRYIFGIILKTTPGDYRIDSETLPIMVGGIGIPTLNREPPTWVVAGVYYEVSTPWIFSDRYVGQVPFGFYTPYVPSAQTGFTIDFGDDGLGAEDYAENTVAATVNDWRWSDLVLTIAGSDQASNFEQARKYVTNNASGNSDVLKVENIFGHAVFGWTPTKIQTTDDVTFTTWDNTTATWTRDGEGDSFEFGDLLCNELARLQEVPAKTYSGSLYGDIIKAHSRIILSDNSAWLLARATFRAKVGIWEGEWIGAGVSTGAGITPTTPVPVPGPEGFPPGTHEIIVSSPDGLSSTTSVSGPSGNTALTMLTVNTTSTLTASGAVTSIDVDEPIRGNTFYDGNIIYLYNPQNGQLYGFEVDGDQSAGATSISVVSVNHGIDIPIGAQLLYSPYNLFTQSTGGPVAGLPEGTAPGQIIRWDNAALKWVIYSGTVDGNVLTWDTTNGWQEQSVPAATGDILDGGNTTGATVVIGTNDNNALNFETNNVVRVAISSGASTGGAMTITDVTANTSTVEDVLSLISNSTGTALAGLGPGIAFYAESSTTDSTLAGRIWAAWTTATHATRKSKIGFHAIYNGSAVEVASFDATNSGDGRLLIGASSPAVYTNNGITTAATYTVGNSSSTLILGGNAGTTLLGGSSGDAQISSSSASTSAILLQLQANAATSNSSIDIGGSTALVQTSGTRNYMKITAGFAPTSGTAVHNSFVINGTFNQTGGASGITRGIYLNQTLTAVADMRLLEIAANGSNTKGIYQTGANVVNNFVGATAFGTTSAPDASAILDIVSTAKGLGLPAMTTAQVNAIGSPRDGLTVYDTDTDTIKLRANGAWVSLGTGSGTITGSGTAGYVAFFDTATSITGESKLFWDATNNRIGIGTNAPAKSLSMITASGTDGIRMESDGTADQDVWGIEFAGTATGPYTQRGKIGLDVYSNSGASPDGHAIIFQLARDGGSTYTALSLYNNEAAFNNASGFSLSNNAGRLRLQATSAGVYSTDTHWLLTTAGTTTNDTNSRLKIVSIGTTSSNYGLRIYNSTPTLIFSVRDDQHVGINVDPSDAVLQVKGLGTTTDKSLLVENSSGTDNFYVQDSGVVSGVAFQTVSAAPTASYGTGAGTGPTTDLLAGGQNGFNFFFTTGTGPAASATVVTINLPKSFANGCAASWVAANAATQAIIGNFWLSGTGNNSITIAYARTLAATTAYALSITVIGY